MNNLTRRMLTKLWFLVMALGCVVLSMNVKAATITRQQAQFNALNFMMERGKCVTPSSLRHVPMRAAQHETAPYYVFNIGDGEGYIIASGDDCAADILGYADSGCFDVNDIPCNMQAWLDEYGRQILSLQAQGGTVTRAPKKSVDYTPIAPLLTSKWSQGYPYNLCCPEVDGNHCVTGCVATAMAQVMYYHRARSVSQTTHEIPAYVTYNLGLNVDAIPAGSPIDWDNMVDDYRDGPTSTQMLAVANLMKYCGAALNMNYGLGNSTAAASSLEVVMSLYFNYSIRAQQVFPSAYTTEEWKFLIYDELSNSRPVLYNGYAEGEGGHSFVCDGYDGNGYYHFNWGWGGAQDGYFLLSAIDGDDADVIFYKRNQGAVINAEPLPTVIDSEAGVHFADPVMRYIGLRNWDTDENGWLSLDEVQAVTDFQLFYTYYSSSYFLASLLSSFDEFKYFTGVNVIDIGSFLDCSNMTRISIPGTVTDIGGSAFMNCSSLKSIVLPKSVSVIGSDAFLGCSAMTSVTCLALVPPALDYGALGSVNEQAILQVPIDALDAYRAATGWNSFTDIVGLDPSLGDVNLDGEVTIADINVIIGTVLTDVNDCLTEYMSDVNGDGEVNIADINVTVDKVLHVK